MTMHTAFGKASAIGQTPDALLAILTNRVENDNALGPQSHGVGPYSEGWLTSRKSALQSTRSTATCPALRGCPHLWLSCMISNHLGLVTLDFACQRHCGLVFTIPARSCVVICCTSPTFTSHACASCSFDTCKPMQYRHSTQTFSG